MGGLRFRKKVVEKNAPKKVVVKKVVEKAPKKEKE